MMNEIQEKAVNELVNTEIWSSNLYLSLQSYFEAKDYPILASWFDMQAKGNMGRAYKLMRYAHRMGCTVEVNQAAFDTKTWRSPMAAFNEVMDHEKQISQIVGSSLRLAANSDFMFYQFMSQLYAHRTYVSNVLMEMFQIIANENTRELPYFKYDFDDIF